jgi:hypothetical protein
MKTDDMVDFEALTVEARENAIDLTRRLMDWHENRMHDLRYELQRLLESKEKAHV